MLFVHPTNSSHWRPKKMLINTKHKLFVHCNVHNACKYVTPLYNVHVCRWIQSKLQCTCMYFVGSTFASVHFPGFWVFSLFITGSVGGICHSPVDGGNELCIPGSSSQNILKPLLAEFEVGMATPIPPFLAEKKKVARQLQITSAINN